MAMAGNTRVTGKEQYYTPTNTADTVIDTLLQSHPHLVDQPWLEPAGGTGSFVDALERRGITDVVSFDIEPFHHLVQRGNFLEQTVSGTNYVSIGNPPFGRNNALSVPFFNKCAEVSDTICFIVPRSWRKWSVTNRLHKHFHLVSDYDLEINYVNVDGVTISDNSHLRTCVQTWQKSDVIRDIVRVTDHRFIRKCTPEEADVSLTVFGFSCGAVRTEFPRVPNTTQMFLKLCDPRALRALQSVDFSRFFNHTAYTQALSLQEINFLLNEHILGDGGIIRSQK
jgi:predicted RNA methylase